MVEISKQAERQSKASWEEILVVALLLLALGGARLGGHLLFHSLAELFIIAVLWGVFFLSWNSRRLLDNHYLLLIGISSLFVGAIDAAHTLAYKGMNVIPGAGADHATQLWIAARYVQSGSFLVAPLFLRRRLKPDLALAIYGVVTAALIASIFSGVFPACYVEGSGLTAFKIWSEYAVILALLASAGLLVWQRAQFDRSVLHSLLAAIGLMAAAEVGFTLYDDVYAAANVIGHFLKFVAFCFIYKAIIVTGVVRPYDLLFRNLVRSEEALRRSDERYKTFVANGSEAIFRVEMGKPVPTSLPLNEQVKLLLDHAYVAECNDAYARMHGLNGVDRAVGARLSKVLLGTDPPAAELAESFIRSGYRVAELEFRRKAENGEVMYVAGSLIGIVENGHLLRIWGVQRDVTEAKRATQ
ncbi:MAG TPA: MASE3 domain-containing protein, partial [Bryobacteraceae bacterium]|nr:MASE3 domain-containing protein [Bryobacteraceae bacterium]